MPPAAQESTIIVMQIIVTVEFTQIIAQKQVKKVPSDLDLRIAFGPGAQLVRPETSS